MSAVERLDHYGSLQAEAAATTPNDPPLEWPTKGAIQFTNVDLAYRPGLPLILKGITFDVKPREKVSQIHTERFVSSNMVSRLVSAVVLVLENLPCFKHCSGSWRLRTGVVLRLME